MVALRYFLALHLLSVYSKLSTTCSYAYSTDARTFWRPTYILVIFFSVTICMTVSRYDVSAEKLGYFSSGDRFLFQVQESR